MSQAGGCGRILWRCQSRGRRRLVPARFPEAGSPGMRALSLLPFLLVAVPLSAQSEDQLRDAFEADQWW